MEKYTVILWYLIGERTYSIIQADTTYSAYSDLKNAVLNGRIKGRLEELKYAHVVHVTVR